MTLHAKLPSLVLPISVGVVACLGLARPVLAQSGEEDDAYCDSVDVHAAKSDCALSTVCGQVQEHYAKPFTGNFADYFDFRNYTGLTCEIMAFQKQVRYQCITVQGRTHRGALDYAGYPKSDAEHAHLAVCKSLLSRHTKPRDCDPETDPGCEKPKPEEPGKPDCDPETDPDCDQPKPEEPGKPDCDPSTDPDCDTPQDPGKPEDPKPEGEGTPECDKAKDPNCDAPKPEDLFFREQCQSAQGRCTVVSGAQVQTPSSNQGAYANYSVSCESNQGVSWGYSEQSPAFEPVGRARLDSLCENELFLCAQPLLGGQGRFFALQDHPQRKISAKCTTEHGECQVDADAAGNGKVNCSCFSPGAVGSTGTVSDMQPGALGAQAQCFVEVQRCELAKGQCPDGCDQDEPVTKGGVWDCSVHSNQARSPAVALLTVLALAGWRRRRERKFK